MSTKYIIYNPFADNGTCKGEAELLEVVYDNCVLIDMCKISNYQIFFAGLDDSDDVILCGGDGTLNRFVNETRDIDIKNNLYFFAVGSGNDFACDIGKEKGGDPLYRINRYIKELPTVTVNGEEHLFINGVGYGIDGYCCEVGDRIREQNQLKNSDKPINYTAIAIKGLLFHYKPTNATITVDGKKHTYKKVWLAPTMNGRYYGGGMMPAPNQERIGKKKKVTLMVMHGTGKLRTLMLFPSIFKGKHVKHKKVVDILSGHDITVEFDRPTPLQIDGETILNVTSYSVCAVNKKPKADPFKWVPTR